MAITTAAFGSSYLFENSKTSFPVVDVPTFSGIDTDGNSEIQAICGFSFQGRSLKEDDMGLMLKAKIKKFGRLYTTSGDLPLLSNLPSVMPIVNTELAGIVRFVICDEDGNELLDTADVVNSADQCPSAGTDIALNPETGLRKEEIIRGEFLHGFVQKDGYFLTYIIHYPTFYEFFSNDGYYGSESGTFGSPAVADYSSQLDKTSLVACAISPEAKSVQSLMAVDIFKDSEFWYAEKPTMSSDGDIKDSLSLLAGSAADYQNIIFNRNDPAGVSRMPATYNPCYISGISGEENNPWYFDDVTLGQDSQFDLSTDFHGDVFFREGFNVDLTTSDPTISFNALPGAGFGDGPECEDSTEKPDGAVRKINSVAPDEVGNVYVGADNCIMVGPLLQPISGSDNRFQYTPVEAAGTEDTPFPGSIRMFNGHPGIDGITESTLANRSGGSPGIAINGFCAECCSCDNYEKVYKALNKVATPVFEDQNGKTGTGLVTRAETVSAGYNCIVSQYQDIVECFKDNPVRVSAAGWGHYGYLVSAQVMIQNHGEEDIKDNLSITFDLGSVGEIDYVANTSYANVDEDDLSSTDFNPAQPLENLPNSGDSVTITTAGTKVSLSGGFLNLSSRTGIRRGRYMMVGILVYLKNKASTDACADLTQENSFTLTAKVDGIGSGSISDSNQYECLSTLFLPTPCTPPIASSLQIINNKIRIRVTGPSDNTNVLHGHSISVNVKRVTDWIEWVPTRTDGGVEKDQCGNIITYKYPDPPIGNNTDIGAGATVTASFTNNEAEIDIPGTPLDELYSETTVPRELFVFCTCQDCADEDDDIPGVGECQECQYTFFPKRVVYTVTYTPGPDDTFDCPLGEEQDDVALEAFTISTPAPATINPSILYYSCDTPAQGAGSTNADCFIAG